MKEHEFRLFRLQRRETGFYFVIFEYEIYAGRNKGITIFSLFSINRYRSILDSKPRTYIKFFHIERPDDEYRQ